VKDIRDTRCGSSRDGHQDDFPRSGIGCGRRVGEELKKAEKSLKGFFTQHAGSLFAVMMAAECVFKYVYLCTLTHWTTTRQPDSPNQPQPSTPSDARALRILDMEASLPWICFSQSIQLFRSSSPPGHRPAHRRLGWHGSPLTIPIDR
jgi:hypothetical protein